MVKFCYLLVPNLQVTPTGLGVSSGNKDAAIPIRGSPPSFLFCSLYIRTNRTEWGDSFSDIICIPPPSPPRAFQATIRLQVLSHCTPLHLLALQRKHIFQLLLRSGVCCSKPYFGIYYKEEEQLLPTFTLQAFKLERKNIKLKVEYRAKTAICTA